MLSNVELNSSTLKLLDMHCHICYYALTKMNAEESCLFG